jgi:nicotinamidase-related amidase
LINKNTALIIVDMQKYYLHTSSDYFRYFDHIQEGCLNYIVNRCRDEVTPNIGKLLNIFREKALPVIYLRLCGTDTDRKDLHPFFHQTYKIGKESGYDNVYPLESDPMSEVIDEIKPRGGDITITKTTFSPFTSTNISTILSDLKLKNLVFTGLATSQCVETTARDASDRGYTVIHLDDAQADYDESSHNISLYASRGVCGGLIYNTDEFIATQV